MTPTRNGTLPTTVVRCALYTRKSTEEGLEQEFNSLDAQRESAEAYVASQRHEGWVCLPERYDDGGYTGGNMDRPALRRLLADIESGKIDAVCVYKVDRLSRSLLDFAKMMETFEKHRVSFVSVTQQLNTATSMGRLVLNVLLSFAQFEREIISERTRDKIAAARRKGKWSGGMPLLGYDIDPGMPKLVVNAEEAVRVRAIFALYLEHRTLAPVVEELHRRGWVNKRWRTRKGHERGGMRFTKTNLYRLLTNPTYAGKVRYKDEHHCGEHAAIVDDAAWQQVQTLLRRKGRKRGRSTALVSIDNGTGDPQPPATSGACLVTGNNPTTSAEPEPATVPPVAQWMALAMHFDTMIRSGHAKDYAALARQHAVTRSRISQIMNLLHLAPDIQEALLFLPPTAPGRDVPILAQLQPIAAVAEWGRQRRLWRALLNGST